MRPHPRSTERGAERPNPQAACRDVASTGEATEPITIAPRGRKVGPDPLPSIGPPSSPGSDEPRRSWRVGGATRGIIEARFPGDKHCSWYEQNSPLVPQLGSRCHLGP